jgi:S-adenosylmethionine uptake transporter
MAGLALGEAITRRALAASVLGLAGVGVIALGRMQGGGALEREAMLGMGAILGSAVLYAANLVMQRHQAQMAPPAEIAFFQSLFTAFFLSLAALVVGFRSTGGAGLGGYFGGGGAFFVSLLALSWGAGAGASLAAHRIFGLSVGRIDGVDMV